MNISVEEYIGNERDVEAARATTRKGRKAKRIPLQYKSRPDDSFNQIFETEPESIHHITDVTHQAKGILVDTFVGLDFPKLGSRIVITGVDNISGYCKLQYCTGSSVHVDCNFTFGLRFVLHLVDHSHKPTKYDAWGFEMDEDINEAVHQLETASRRGRVVQFGDLTTRSPLSGRDNGTARSAASRHSRKSARSEELLVKSGKTVGVIASMEAVTRELAKEQKHDQRLDIGKEVHVFELPTGTNPDSPPKETFSFVAKKMADLTIRQPRLWPYDPTASSSRLSTAVATMLPVDKDKKKKRKKRKDEEESDPTRPYRGRLILSRGGASRLSSRAQTAPDDTVLGKSFGVSFWDNRYVPPSTPLYREGVEFVNEEGNVVFTSFEEQAARFKQSIFSSSPAYPHLNQDRQDIFEPDLPPIPTIVEPEGDLFENFLIAWLDTSAALQPQGFERVQAESLLHSMNLKNRLRAAFQDFKEKVVILCGEQSQPGFLSTGFTTAPMKGILTNRTPSMRFEPDEAQALSASLQGASNADSIRMDSAAAAVATTQTSSSPVAEEDDRPKTSLGRLLSFSPLSKKASSGFASLFSTSIKSLDTASFARAQSASAAKSSTRVDDDSLSPARTSTEELSPQSRKLPPLTKASTGTPSSTAAAGTSSKDRAVSLQPGATENSMAASLLMTMTAATEKGGVAPPVPVEDQEQKPKTSSSSVRKGAGEGKFAGGASGVLVAGGRPSTTTSNSVARVKGDVTRPGTARSAVSFGFVEDDAGGRSAIDNPVDARRSGGPRSSGAGGVVVVGLTTDRAASSRSLKKSRSSTRSLLSRSGREPSFASLSSSRFDGSSLVSTESGRRLASAAAGLNRIFLAEYDEFDAQDRSDDEDK